MRRVVGCGLWVVGVWLTVWPVFGVVDGTVLNRTTGKTQPNATVTLYKLGGAGMESIESVKSDAQGRFKIDQTPQGPHLIQTAYDGVTYNHMLPPGSPATNLELEVYNSSQKPGDAKVTTHMVLFEPAGDTLVVNESIIFQNSGKVTYNDPDGGTLKFYLPSAAGGQVRIMANAPQGMPVQRAAVKTAQQDVYKVDFPIKPGETRFDLVYQFPFTTPGEFTGKTLHKEGSTRLVAPQGVTITGDGLRPEGREPRTQASIFTVGTPVYTVRIEGTGSLRAAAEGADDDSRPTIQQVLPRIYDKVYWILGLSLMILALGFYLFYRRQPPAPATTSHKPQATSQGRKRR